MVRKVEARDLGTIKEWFFNQTGVHLSEDLLSDHGYIYEEVAALFFYPTIGCKMALVGWPIANPASHKSSRSMALNALLLHVEREAKSQGYKWLTSYASRDSVASRFEGQGYRMGDTSVTQFIKNLEVR